MKKNIKEALNFIKIMNEQNSTEEERQIRKKAYIASLKGEKVDPEADKLFVRDTVGTPAQWREMLGYSKEVIRQHDPKPKVEVPKEEKKLIKPIGNFRKLSEAEELQKQSLANSMEDVRLDFAKNIMKSMYDIQEFKKRAVGQYGIDDLMPLLDQKLEEDGVTLENAKEVLSDDQIKELNKFKKELVSLDKEEDIDLGDELTPSEKKKLDQEPSIEEKNEVTEEDTTFGASDKMEKYLDDQVVIN